MATKVDELIVEIKAETRGLRKGLDQVNRKLQTANTTAKSSVATFQNLAKVFAVLGLARVATGVVATVRQFEDLEATLQANTGNAIETAKALDMITEFTATTTFQIEEVTSAFIELKRKGISATRDEMEGLGKVAAANNTSIQRVAEGVTRAATTSIEQLQMLGFTGKSSGDQITLSYGEGADKITKTFEKTSRNVMQFVAEIGEARFDTAIEDRANTVTGAFSNMADNVSFFAEAIGEGGLKPVLIEFARTMSTVLQEAKPLARAIGVSLKLAFDGLKFVVAFIETNMEKLMEHFDQVRVRNFANSLKIAVTAFVAYRAAVLSAAVATAIFNQMVKLNPVLKMVSGIQLLVESVDNLGEHLDEGLDFVMDLTGLKALEEAIHSAFTLPPEAQESIDKLNELDTTLTIGINKAAQTTSEVMVELAGVMQQTSNAFTNDFVNSLMDGRDALESFKNFSKNLVSQIISTFLQMTVVNKILNHIFGNVTGFQPLPTANPSQFIGRGSAGGGTVQANRPVLVGERGAEIFVPNTSGSIMNHADSKGVGGGGLVVNQQISFSTGVVPTVRAEVSKMLPQIADVTKFAVLEAAQRGGSFRKGLQGA